MKKNRIKIHLPNVATRDDAETLMTDLAALVNEQRTVAAERDAEVLAINSRYESDLAKLDQNISARTDALRAWAESNPAEFPKGRKSLTMLSGVLGFRTGTPTLALLNRRWSWAKVLAAIKQFSLADWVRTKETVAKDLIISEHASAKDPAEFSAGVLAPIGVKVVREESFFIEPNLTDLETRQVQSTEAA